MALTVGPANLALEVGGSIPPYCGEETRWSDIQTSEGVPTQVRHAGSAIPVSTARNDKPRHITTRSGRAPIASFTLEEGHFPTWLAAGRFALLVASLRLEQEAI